MHGDQEPSWHYSLGISQRATTANSKKQKNKSV